MLIANTWPGWSTHTTNLWRAANCDGFAEDTGMPQLSHLLTLFSLSMAGFSTLRCAFYFLLPSTLLRLLVKPAWCAGAAGPAGSVHSSWQILSNCSAANFESTCPSAFSSHLVFELFLSFVGFGVFLLAGNPLSKTVQAKPDSPVTVQLCYRS